MAISWTSESTLLWKSMAIVVIFGLLVSTILTLFVVPALYTLFENIKQWFATQNLSEITKAFKKTTKSAYKKSGALLNFYALKFNFKKNS